MPAAACARSCRRWGSRGAPARSRHDRREAMGAAAQARVGPAPLVRERNPGRRGAADGGAPPRRVPALPGRDRHLPAAGRDPPADPGDRADGPSRPARPADGADRGRGAGQPPRLARRPAGPGARPRLPGPLDAAARPRRARRAVAPPRRRDGSLRPLAPATGGSRSRARVSDPLRERSGTGGRGPVAARLRRKDNGAGGPRSAPRYPRPDRLRPLRARGVHRGGPRRARSPGEGVGAPARPAPGEPGRAGGRTAVNLQRFRGPRGEVLALLLAFALGCAGVRTPPATTASAAADQGSGLATSHQVMVTLKPAPPTIWTKTTYEIAQDYQLRTVFAWTMVSLNEQCIVFEIPRNRSQEEILRRLRADPRVGTAQPIATFDALSGESSYNDPYAHLQRSIQALDLDKAHRLATGKGVRIAVIDTGVDVSHPDLRGRIARVGNFVEHGEQEFTNDINGGTVDVVGEFLLAVLDEVAHPGDPSPQVRMTDVDAGVDDRDPHPLAGGQAMRLVEVQGLDGALQVGIGIVVGRFSAQRVEGRDGLRRADPRIGAQTAQDLFLGSVARDLEDDALLVQGDHGPGEDRPQLVVLRDLVRRLGPDRRRRRFQGDHHLVRGGEAGALVRRRGGGGGRRSPDAGTAESEGEEEG